VFALLCFCLVLFSKITSICGQCIGEYRDLALVDNQLPQQFNEAVITGLQAIVCTIYLFIDWHVCFVMLFFFQTKRWALELRSLLSLYSCHGMHIALFIETNKSFNEVVSGLETVRAYQMQKYFTAKVERQIEKNSVSYWTLFIANRWFGAILEGLTVLQTAAVVLLCVIIRDQIGPAVASFAITYCLLFGGSFQYMTS
ncbi:ATP-dependent bile acid permease, partial [Reticulomyxa filosa]